MTDDQKAPQDADGAVAPEVDDTGATVVGAVADDSSILPYGGAAAYYENAVIVAAFADEDAAYRAYDALRDAEGKGQFGIDGVLVIETDADGKISVQKMTDHSTKTGFKWGAVGGVVLGIFFPPAIIAATVGTAVFGGVLGKIRNEWHKSEASNALAGALGPNESGILALVGSGDLDAVKQTMPQATKFRTAGVDDATATKIKEVSAQAS